MVKRCLLILTLFFTCAAQAWNANGHMVVAQIAYDNLTPKARLAVDSLTNQFNKAYPTYNNFVIASYWPDDLRNSGVTAFNTWHFINRPWDKKQTYSKRHFAKDNVVWAIEQSEATLQSSDTAPTSKALFLMFLTHFVADVHQPLHAITLYDKKFPKGDKGGTLYLIKSPIANNLHELWDKGGDFFYQQRGSSALTLSGIPQLANKIQKDYPPNFFGNKVQNLNPQAWSYESYDLAKEYAYKLPYNGTPSPAYLAKTQEISEQQVALAGYRLAAMLNKLLA